MKKFTIALLSGGTSSERNVSIASGEQVYSALNKEKYNILRYDPASDLKKLISDAGEIDFALIIMHGKSGEDGSVQGLLELLKIPYQGSGISGSAIAMNKLLSKRLYEYAKVPIPPYMLMEQGKHADKNRYIEKLGLPVIVKPVTGGSSIGISVVKKEEEFNPAVKKAFDQDKEILIETYIEGIELTCGVIGNKEIKALPVIQISPDKEHEFFDYEAKYVAGVTKEICPAPIDDQIAKQVQKLAKKSHEILNCRGCSRTDMILNNGELFILETNTIPGMTPTSLLPLAAKFAGIDFGDLLEKLIKLGLKI